MQSKAAEVGRQVREITRQDKKTKQAADEARKKGKPKRPKRAEGEPPKSAKSVQEESLKSIVVRVWLQSKLCRSIGHP